MTMNARENKRLGKRTKFSAPREFGYSGRTVLMLPFLIERWKIWTVETAILAERR